MEAAGTAPTPCVITVCHWRWVVPELRFLPDFPPSFFQPYDQNYMEKNKIKHMSFHAHLRKLNAANRNAAKNVNALPPLDEPSFAVKKNCDAGHAPYPQSMCAKCQPSAIVLQQQTYRMVDHVEFESAGIVDEFLSFWRKTGLQRLGYLYGRYERYSEVPLGVKAVVAAIYEPQQQPAVDGVELVEHEPHGKTVDELAHALGLQKVGMIYSDLHDDGSGTGKVICRRKAETFFVSSAEIIFMANAQADHPNPCRFSTSGKFGSKFITVIVSGDAEKNIHLSAYQVSNIGAAMTRDGIIDATVKANVLRVRDSTSTHYVPDVFYKYKNKYGALVQEAARPTFPVEYLLVSLTEGFPQQPRTTFRSTSIFAVENRGGLATQDMSAVRKHMDACGGDMTKALSDFHLLVYLKSSGVFSDSDWARLLSAVKSGDVKVLEKELMQNASFQTLSVILSETPANTSSSSGQPSAAAAAAPWSCRHCTFANAGSRRECDMCGLPQD